MFCLLYSTGVAFIKLGTLICRSLGKYGGLVEILQRCPADFTGGLSYYEDVHSADLTGDLMAIWGHEQMNLFWTSVQSTHH